ncbi:MAG: hypothetical protein HY718_15840, partial [Planctomycetes bacterium]|nr:hypothetical protein [Planctomycetota bacterium]
LGAPIVTSQAGRTRVAWSRLLDVGPPSFGMSVFPLKRELIILATAWVLLLPPRIRWRTAAIGLLLLVQALLIIRMAGADPIHPRIGGIVLGLLNLLAAVVILVWRSPRPQAARENVPTSLFVMKELG